MIEQEKIFYLLIRNNKIIFNYNHHKILFKKR